MGVWSEPLCVVPRGLVCNKAVLPTPLLELFLRHCTGDVGTEPSVDKTHAGMSDTAKIWGYFDKDELEFWKQYTSAIISQNPGAGTTVEFHFFCTDFSFPFIIGSWDGNFGVKKAAHEMNPRWTNVEAPSDVKSCSESDDDNGLELVGFDKDRYIAYMGDTKAGRAHAHKVRAFFEPCPFA